MRAEGIDITDEDTRAKIGTISLTGFSLAPTLEGLKALEGKSEEEFTASFRPDDNPGQ